MKIFLFLLILLHGCFQNPRPNPHDLNEKPQSGQLDLNEIFKENITLDLLVKKFGAPIALDENKDVEKKTYYFKFMEKYDVTEKYGRLHYISGAMVYAIGNQVVSWDFATTIE